MQLKRRFKPAALAVAAGLTVGAAQAQSSVTLYGQVDAWVGAQKGFDSSRAGVVNPGGMSTSYWGLKGSEDLGNGLKSLFALEAFFRPDTGRAGRFDGDNFFARNAFVGLSSNAWGSIKLGRNTPPYSRASSKLLPSARAASSWPGGIARRPERRSSLKYAAWHRPSATIENTASE